MSSQNNDSRTFVANAAMTQFHRVALSTNGGVDHADNTVAGVGVLQASVEANGPAVVRLPGVGTYKVAITGAPVTAGDSLYAAANGYAAATGTVALNLQAFESTSTNASVIEAIPTF